MLRLYDFGCPNCGHTYETMVDVDVRTDTCPECARETSRLISAVRCKLDPISGDFPGATMKWARAHEKGGGYTPDESE